MATYERLDYGSPDGSQWGGASTDALGLYGVQPVTQYNAVGAVSAYEFSSTNGGASGLTFGFSTFAMATSLMYQVSSINAAGRRLGLWA